jgi:hypothetical protein
MRGDSLRDLYAKSMALMGLALLAAVGAVVDYWPARLSVPHARVIPSFPTDLKPLPIADAAPLLAALSTPERRSVKTMARVAPATVDDSAAVAARPEATMPVEPVPDPSASAALQEVPTSQIVTVPVEPVAQVEPELSESRYVLTTIAPASGGGSPGGPSAFLAGAKRLPRTILSGGAKAGILVADAVQTAGEAVGGAVTSGVKKIFRSF